jgi:aryl-alcohol dehydrogenase-like predicted oxidoreductase
MTWGNQNTEAEGHAQLDYALSEGINFIDTAEMYPIPGNPKTQGSTEEIIGTWIKKRGKRDDFILASKVTGRSGMNWVRSDGAETRHTRAQIDEAVEGSLRRLQTDYLDLYQLHWLDRNHPGVGFGFHAYRDYDTNDMEPLGDILETLQRHVDKGNIRHIGLSNETPWGTMKYLALSEAKDLPRPVSIQNVYSLVSRRFDYGLAEVAMREDIGLLAYSPLAQGYLTGKYRDSIPKNSRKDLFDFFLARYEGTGGMDAVNDCLDVAKELSITPTQFALKFVETREFVTSNIIGATSLEQLKENIDAHKIEWTKDMEKASYKLQTRHHSPCP